MMLIENKIIRKVISNLQKYFDELKNLISIKPKYKNIYSSLYERYRELIGKQMWINGSDLKFEDEIAEEFLDLEIDTKKLLAKIKEEHGSI